jgi:UTP--glucose-1-phosphate uridylyltransferase
LIDAPTPVMAQMTELYGRFSCTILGVQQVSREETSQYGIIKGRVISSGLYGVTAIVEKPRPEAAPSTIGVVGRYILSPRIFEHLAKVQRGAGGEIQLTDAIASLIAKEEVIGYEFSGTRYDCGSKLGYLKANLAFALKHPEVGAECKAYLNSLGCRVNDD